jgi:hypothetical protein
MVAVDHHFGAVGYTFRAPIETLYLQRVHAGPTS